MGGTGKVTVDRWDPDLISELAYGILRTYLKKLQTKPSGTTALESSLFNTVNPPTRSTQSRPCLSSGISTQVPSNWIAVQTVSGGIGMS